MLGRIFRVLTLLVLAGFAIRWLLGREQRRTVRELAVITAGTLLAGAIVIIALSLAGVRNL